MSFISWFRNKKLKIGDQETTNIEYKRSLDKICLDDAKKLNTDLVEATYFLGCCSECAKYRGRWFSISGKDKRFPKMPNMDKCECSGIEFFPAIYGISEPVCCPKGIDIISYSNRPFVDDRTQEEKQTHAMFKKENEIEEWFEPYRQRKLAIKEKDKQQYAWLCKNLPDIAPKSMGGFTRMKNSNSKNFKKLAEEAQKFGVEITYSDEDIKELEYLKPFEEKYNKVKGECLQYYHKN